MIGRLYASLLIGAVAVVAVGAVASSVYLKGKRAGEAVAEAALDQGASDQLTAEGAATTAAAVDAYTGQGARIVERTYEVRIEAAAAPDADAGLDPARAARLGRHDRFLCDERPGLVGCKPAAGDDAG